MVQLNKAAMLYCGGVETACNNSGVPKEIGSNIIQMSGIFLSIDPDSDTMDKLNGMINNVNSTMYSTNFDAAVDRGIIRSTEFHLCPELVHNNDGSLTMKFDKQSVYPFGYNRTTIDQPENDGIMRFNLPVKAGHTKITHLYYGMQSYINSGYGTVKLSGNKIHPFVLLEVGLPGSGAPIELEDVEIPEDGVLIMKDSGINITIDPNGVATRVN